MHLTPMILFVFALDSRIWNIKLFVFSLASCSSKENNVTLIGKSTLDYGKTVLFCQQDDERRYMDLTVL
jgi:hypothetical protein